MAGPGPRPSRGLSSGAQLLPARSSRWPSAAWPPPTPRSSPGQRVVTKKLSQLGPGVAWHDLDRDGWEDLIIGSGKGGRLAVYRNNGKGAFTRMTNAVLEQIVTRDQTGVLGLGEGKILVGSAN